MKNWENEVLGTQFFEGRLHQFLEELSKQGANVLFKAYISCKNRIDVVIT